MESQKSEQNMKCGESQDIHMAVEFGLYKEDQVVIQPIKDQQCATNIQQIFNRIRISLIR